MSDIRKAGTTDQQVELRMLDATTGDPETGVTSATSGLELWYRREGGLKVTFAASDLSALNDAHSDGGILHVSDGYYRVDVPDAAFAGSADFVVIGWSATGMYGIAARVQLVAYDPQDTVRLGLTALPNAAADAAGGLPISDAGGLDLDAKIGALTFTVAGKVDANATHISGDSTAADNAELFFDGTGYNAANSAIGTVATATAVTTVNGLANNVITTASINDGAITGPKVAASLIAKIWDYLTSAIVTSGSIGKFILDKLGLITSTTTLSVSVVSNGDTITIYQGETRTTDDGNAITLAVSSADVDLTGYTPKFGLTKITSNSGTSTLEVSGTVTNAGTTAQAVVFELTSAQTAALALDPTVTNPFQQNPANSKAYRWTISATDGSTNCPTLAAGYASVKARDTTC